MIRHPARCLLPVLAAMSLQLSACSDDSSATQPTDNASDNPSSDAGADDQEDWIPLRDTPAVGSLDPGAYALTAYGSVPSLAVIQAPEGYGRYEDWTFVAGEETPEGRFRAVGYLTTDTVFGDPCSAKGGPKDDTVYYPGATVEDLAHALVTQEGAITSDPEPVAIDGYDGLYLDYRVPEIDIARCEYGVWDIFPDWRLVGAGERAGIWILDVDGQRVLLAWVASASVAAEDIREMTDMVGSTRFVDPR